MKRFAWLLYFAFIPLSLLENADASLTSLLIVSVLTFAFIYIFLAAPRDKTSPTSIEPVRMGARFWAFMIDCLVVAACLSGVIVLMTSVFSTSDVIFTRTFNTVQRIGFYTGPIFMNWVAFRFGKQTPGQYILQFRVISAHGQKGSFWKRILHLYTLMFSVNEKDGIFLWDRKSNTRAISTRQPN